MAVVKFNRHFTQAQLDAARDTSSINGTAVVEGTWYVASSSPTSVFLGVPSGNSVVLKMVGEVADGKYLKLSGGTMDGNISMDGNKITDLATPGDSLDAANKAYVDDKISNLGAIMTFKGTKATESALKTDITTPHKGDVYIVTADNSEWVYSGDTVDSTHAYDSTKWEKFGTTDVQGALYKGTTWTVGNIVVAQASDGKSKTISLADGLSFSEDAELQVSLAPGDWNEDVPDSGSWKTPYVRASLDGGEATGELSLRLDGDLYLKGYYQSIPAATASSTAALSTDGYMTGQQAYNLSLATACLTWED